MTRVKRGFIGKRHHKKILKLNKGFRGSHSRLFETANQQNMKAERYSYFDRRKKKSDFKKIWIQRINAAVRKYQINYSKLIKKLKESKIILNKKVLARLSTKDEKIFNKLIEKL